MELHMKKTIIIPPDIKLLAWGEGPWIDEPDQVEFEYKGYSCSVERHISVDKESLSFLVSQFKDIKQKFPDNPLTKYLPLGLGHLCGYIRIPKGHPWEGVDRDSIDASVHGGLTYGERREDRYCIGFDCAHSGDTVPAMAACENFGEFKNLKQRFPNSSLWNNSYKTVQYVINECKDLVDQAIKVGKEWLLKRSDL